MLSAVEQLRRLEAQLLGTGGFLLRDPVAYALSGDREGILRLALEYVSGHRLYVNVRLDVSHGYPVWTDYRFHLQDPQGHCVFRYDCSPHYAGMATFPHHKHVGRDETPQETPLPTLRDIVAEVVRCVAQ